MKRLIEMLLLLMVAVAPMAQNTDSTNTSVLKNVNGGEADMSFATLDSIRMRATALYASKVLRAGGYKMAYGRDVDQKDWRKYHFHEVAFSNTACYDEKRDAWKIRKNQPFSYVRLVYDGDTKRLYHYQVKFATREGFLNFQKDAIENGFRYKSKSDDKVDKGIECTFYNAKSNCYLVFGEYEDGQLLIDMWTSDSKLGR